MKDLAEDAQELVRTEDAVAYPPGAGHAEGAHPGIDRRLLDLGARRPACDKGADLVVQHHDLVDREASPVPGGAACLAPDRPRHPLDRVLARDGKELELVLGRRRERVAVLAEPAGEPLTDDTPQ